jgi:hypothetical protein
LLDERESIMTNQQIKVAAILVCSAVIGVSALSPAIAQFTRVSPVLAVKPADQTMTEQINQLSAEITSLKSRLAEDEQKLAEAGQAATDAKTAVAFMNSGYDSKFKDVDGQLAYLHNNAVNLTLSVTNFKSAYEAHAHGFSRTAVGFTNVPLGGGSYASLIKTVTAQPDTTTPPK